MLARIYTLQKMYNDKQPPSGKKTLLPGGMTGIINEMRRKGAYGEWTTTANNAADDMLKVGDIAFQYFSTRMIYEILLLGHKDTRGNLNTRRSVIINNLQHHRKCHEDSHHQWVDAVLQYAEERNKSDTTIQQNSLFRRVKESIHHYFYPQQQHNTQHTNNIDKPGVLSWLQSLISQEDKSISRARLMQKLLGGTTPGGKRALRDDAVRQSTIVRAQTNAGLMHPTQPIHSNISNLRDGLAHTVVRKYDRELLPQLGKNTIRNAKSRTFKLQSRLKKDVNPAKLNPRANFNRQQQKPPSRQSRH